MKRVWWRADPHALQKLEDDLAAEALPLRISVEGATVILTGTFPLKLDTEIVDEFDVEIEIPVDFPESIPRLRETGTRIPWTKERHVEPTGFACPIVPEEWLLAAERASIIAFLKGPVRNFFLGQSLVERGVPWPFGERAHFRDGLLQSYGEMIGTNDASKIEGYLRCLSQQGLKGGWECPCGSGKHLRNCHIHELQILRDKIPHFVAQGALRRLNGGKA